MQLYQEKERQKQSLFDFGKMLSVRAKLKSLISHTMSPSTELGYIMKQSYLEDCDSLNGY